MSEDRDRFKLPPIEPPAPRWEPTPNPEDIVVPGLDTSAPLQDQIEQLDQLITIKLQNIDAHFARAHQVLSTKILPAVRRYAVNTEPVRDAARFWISFFEQAAQVRIPTTDDFSAEAEAELQEEEEQALAHGNAPVPGEGSVAGTFDPNMTPSESSFAPDALVSSTPMVDAHARQRSAGTEDETPSSWAASIESPFERLDKGLRSLGQEEGQDSIMDRSRQSVNDVTSSQSADASSARTPVFTAPNKGKAKAQSSSLLQSVLSKNLRDGEASPRKKHVSPLKVKKTPKRNPYARSDAARADWDGIVDLSKQRDAKQDWKDEDETFQPRDVSGPASSRFPAQVGRTPVREAAARIGRDLIGRAEQSRQPLFGIAAPDSPESPETPSLSMYSRRALGMENESASSSSVQNESISARSASVSDSHVSAEPSLRGMMHQFGLSADSSADHHMDHPGTRGGGEDSFDDSFDDDTPAAPIFASLALQSGDRDVDMEDSDSDSDEDGNGRPGAAFLMAAAQQSYDSDQSSDSLDGGGGGGGGQDYADEEEAAAAPIHPFARGFSASADDSAFDDSFDNSFAGGGGAAGDDEPTVFGPIQSAAHHGGASGANLQLLGQELVDDTAALDSRLRSSNIPDTPTPWSGPGL